LVGGERPQEKASVRGLVDRFFTEVREDAPEPQPKEEARNKGKREIKRQSKPHQLTVSSVSCTIIVSFSFAFFYIDLQTVYVTWPPSLSSL
jgi:hypothetical protein